MEYWFIVVAYLNHDQRQFFQMTKILLQILSKQQFLTAGTFEKFLRLLGSVKFPQN